MVRKNRLSRWWQIGVFVLLLGILCVLEARAPLSPTGHTVVQLGIVLFVFGLLLLWLHLNQGGLLGEMYDNAIRQTTSSTASLQPETGTMAGRDDIQEQSSSLRPPSPCQPEVELSPVTREMEW